MIADLPGVAWAIVLVGPFIGSFVAATADRLIAGTPMFTARSRCDACGRALGPLELVPLLSFAWLQGRCRTCAAAIPRHLPAAEIAGGIIGVASALAAPGWLSLAAALLGWTLLFLALLDLRAFWLPRRGGWGLALAGLGVAAALGREPFHAALIGAAIGWAGLAGLALAYARLRGREGLGEGDPPLLAAAGAWVGWQGLPGVVLLASLTGLTHALAARRSDRTVQIPFGAHLAFAIWFVFLAGGP